MTDVTTPDHHTLHVPGATLTYDVRLCEDSSEPVLLLIGSPMAAAGFGTLAGHFADRTVVTYDPRGSERSTVDDPSADITPRVHADDLHRLIRQVGGPVDLFASSGGAVNALELVARYPGDVRTLVAHEPPIATILPDAPYAMAVCRSIHDSYMAHGFGAGMAHFIAIVGYRGEFDEDFLRQPPPEPAAFGLPAVDDGGRHDPMLSQGILHGTHYEPDVDALLAATTRIVLAAGVGSEGEMANRGAHAMAALLGRDVVSFPGDHGGFLGGEYGQTGEPGAFAARLREVLASA